MDSITQGLLGATVAHVGFSERLGPRAKLIGAICGVLPDLDMFTRVLGPWASMKYHRAESHSLLVLSIVAPLIAWILIKAGRKRDEFWSWTALCWWSLCTHPILDGFTSYGTQLLAPVSRHRFAWDGIAIIDPIYSTLLLAAVLIASYSQSTSEFPKRLVKGALLLSCLYLLLGYTFGRYVEHRFHQRLEREGVEDIVEMRATPTLLNIFLWHVVVKREDGNFILGQMSGLVPDEPCFFSLQSQQDMLVRNALDTREGRLFRWFAQGMVSAEVKDDTVTLYDHRYGMASSPKSTPFCCRFVFDENGYLLEAKRVRGNRERLSIKKEFSLLLEKIIKGARLVDAPPTSTKAKSAGHDSVRRDSVRHDSVRHDSVRRSSERPDSGRRETVRQDSVRHDSVRLSDETAHARSISTSLYGLTGEHFIQAHGRKNS